MAPGFASGGFTVTPVNSGASLGPVGPPLSPHPTTSRFTIIIPINPITTHIHVCFMDMTKNRIAAEHEEHLFTPRDFPIPCYPSLF